MVQSSSSEAEKGEGEMEKKIRATTAVGGRKFFFVVLLRRSACTSEHTHTFKQQHPETESEAPLHARVSVCGMMARRKAA